MPCKPGVAGSIPGFSIKTTFGEPLGVPVIKPTQILTNPAELVYTQESHKKVFFFVNLNKLSVSKQQHLC